MPLNTDRRQLLNSLYYGEEEGAFAGAARLHAAARQHDQSIPLRDVVHFLRQQKSYQEFREATRRPSVPRYKSKRFIVVGGPGHIAIDTMVSSWSESKLF